MTGVALPRPGGIARPSRPAFLSTPLLLEVAVFCLLAGFGTAQWARLVEAPPIGRLVVSIGVVALAGLGLRAVAAAGLRPGRRRFAALVVALAGTGLAMVVVGLPARLLIPTNWHELFAHLGDGLSGIEESELPYTGPEKWVRLTLLLGVPALLGLAAAAAFWPARRRVVPRALGLAALLALYGVAVTLDDPGHELFWGFPLLILSAAWLWIPGLGSRQAGQALAVVALAGLVSLPIAARLDASVGAWNWENWTLFTHDRAVSFQWDHTYGPLDWPQDGTKLFAARSERPLYWKTSVLDRFNGAGWERAERTDAAASAERQARRSTPGGELAYRNGDWLTQATISVDALSSEFAIGAGTTQVVQGIGGVHKSLDGTLTINGAPLSRDEEYSIVAYSPEPTERRLRAAPDTYSQDRFGGSLLLQIPEASGQSPPLEMPTWGRTDADVRRAMRVSPYARDYRLAQRLTHRARTPYEAVLAIEAYLRRGFEYSPDVPEHVYPLDSFLFEDRRGYCQQFAGSMGLMLRMLGIPTRVVSGFAPGTYDKTLGTYAVRDYDAHSWVEVYFRGIGWVTFDPTPSAAPASSQASGAGIGDLRRGGGIFATRDVGRRQSPERPGGPQGATAVVSAQEGGGPWGTVGIAAALLVIVVGGAGILVFWRRRAALAGGGQATAQLEELRLALERLGAKMSPDSTLLAIERRYDRTGRAAVARYARGLRAHRFAPDSPPPPGPAARRELRSALAGGSFGARLRGLIAIPPGGPRGGGRA